MSFNSAHIRFWVGLAISLFFNSIIESVPVTFTPLVHGADDMMDEAENFGKELQTFPPRSSHEEDILKNSNNLDSKPAHEADTGHELGHIALRNPAEVVQDSQAVVEAKLVQKVNQIPYLNLEDFVRNLKDIKALSNEKKVLLMFDVDGTLKSHLDKDRKIIDPWVHELLGVLSQDPRFQVYLNTGKSDQSLRATYKGEQFKQMGWYAEHGAFHSPPGHPEPIDLRTEIQRKWLGTTMERIKGMQVDVPDINKDMQVGASDKKEIWPGQGLRDQSKAGTITFTTRHRNEEFDKFFQDLKSNLEDEAVVTQHKETGTLIEITPKHINKGTAVDHLMKDKTYDLAVAAGDDERDFEMHERILQNNAQHGKDAYSIIITQDTNKPTAANFKLGSYHDLVKTLARIPPTFEKPFPLDETPSLVAPDWWAQTVKVKNDKEDR